MLHIFNIFKASTLLSWDRSVFSLLRRLSTWHCPHLLLSMPTWHAVPAPKAIDRYLLPVGCSAANLTCRMTGQTGRWMDAQPLHAFVSVYYVSSSLLSHWKLDKHIAHYKATTEKRTDSLGGNDRLLYNFLVTLRWHTFRIRPSCKETRHCHRLQTWIHTRIAHFKHNSNTTECLQLYCCEAPHYKRDA